MRPRSEVTHQKLETESLVLTEDIQWQSHFSRKSVMERTEGRKLLVHRCSVGVSTSFCPSLEEANTETWAHQRQ